MQYYKWQDQLLAQGRANLATDPDKKGVLVRIEGKATHQPCRRTDIGSKKNRTRDGVALMKRRPSHSKTDQDAPILANINSN